MRFVLFLMFVFGIISCEKKDDELESFIVSKKWNEYLEFCNVVQIDKNGNTLPPPPPRFKTGYGNQNFIIDDSLNLFYYQFKPEIIESCIESYDDTIPYFQNLRTDMVIQLPLSSINEFVKLNFKKGNSDKIKIATQKDTLNSNVYFKLISALKEQLDYGADRDVYAIFPTTQEEDSVLYYFKNKKVYYPKEIKWDRKRIRFFTKPKIDLK